MNNFRQSHENMIFAEIQGDRLDNFGPLRFIIFERTIFNTK